MAWGLTTLIALCRKPGMIVGDYRTELTSNASLNGRAEHKIEWHDIAPGKPMHKGFAECSNGMVGGALLYETLPQRGPYSRSDQDSGHRLLRRAAALGPRRPDPCRRRPAPHHRNRPTHCTRRKFRAPRNGMIYRLRSLLDEKTMEGHDRRDPWLRHHPRRHRREPLPGVVLMQSEGTRPGKESLSD